MTVTFVDWKAMISLIKQQCREPVESLMASLDERFPQCDLLVALGIVFPQFWCFADAEEKFPLHLVVIRRHFGVTQIVGFGGVSR